MRKPVDLASVISHETLFDPLQPSLRPRHESQINVKQKKKLITKADSVRERESKVKAFKTDLVNCDLYYGLNTVLGVSMFMLIDVSK